MSGLSVIIPSRTAGNLIACIEAVRRCEPEVRIVAVWDGPAEQMIALPQVECAIPAKNDKGEYERSILRWVLGAQPFVFARNVNLGIQAAGDDDVVLLNDDALLESPGGFTLMQQAAQDPQFGLISATTNLAGNPAQLRRAGARACRECPTPTPGNSFATVAFVCVLIPRRTINAIGLLDERFGGTTPEGKRFYGWEDNDYSRRLHNAGLKIGIHDGCFVSHDGKTLKSTYRSEPFDMEAGRQIYLKKVWLHVRAIMKTPVTDECRYTTADVCDLTGATARQLQWWDERGVLRPSGGIQEHSRRYSVADLEIARRMVQLRRAGVSIQQMRRSQKLPEWKTVVTTQLSAVVVGDVLVVFKPRYSGAAR